MEIRKHNSKKLAPLKKIWQLTMQDIKQDIKLSRGPEYFVMPLDPMIPIKHQLLYMPQIM